MNAPRINYTLNFSIFTNLDWFHQHNRRINFFCLFFFHGYVFENFSMFKILAKNTLSHDKIDHLSLVFSNMDSFVTKCLKTIDKTKRIYTELDTKCVFFNFVFIPLVRISHHQEFNLYRQSTIEKFYRHKFLSYTIYLEFFHIIFHRFLSNNTSTYSLYCIFKHFYQHLLRS